METQLTNEQVTELFKDVKLTFSCYYKYSFTFIGEKNGYKINATYGTNPDDIYRFSVFIDKAKEFVSPESWDFVFIEKDGIEVYKYVSI